MCPRSDGSCQKLVDELNKQIQLKDKQIDSLNDEVANLREQVSNLLSRLFGASSERSVNNEQSGEEADASDVSDDSNGSDEGEHQADTQNQAANDDNAANTGKQDASPGAGKADSKRNSSKTDKKKRGGGRNPLPEHLPRVLMELAYAKNCNDCGSPMRIIDIRRVEKLAVLPLLYYVMVYVYTHTACPCCEDKICCPPAEPSLVPYPMHTSFFSNF